MSEIEKDCDNCKFEYLNRNAEPCIICIRNFDYIDLEDRWEEKIIHHDNQEIVDKYKGTDVIVWSFIEDGLCPNCNEELENTEFNTYACYKCWKKVVG